MEDTDIFDFSGMSKVVNIKPLVVQKIDNNKAEEKPAKPVKAPSAGVSSAKKALDEQDFQLGSFFQGKN